MLTAADDILQVSGAGGHPNESHRTETRQAPQACAACFIADINFALPTLICAKGFRHFVPPELADVYILTLDWPAEAFERIAAYAEAWNIRLRPIDPSAIDALRADASQLSHISKAALGRFLLADLVPGSYRRLLYLDGDLWFRRDPMPLVTTVPPAGKMLAADDVLHYVRRTHGPMGTKTKAYMAGLGLADDDGYLNSGVILADVDTWRTIGKAAYDFFARNPELCRYQDQSALNAAARGRWHHLSPIWNFSSGYRQWGLDGPLEPVVYHFAGGHKPWLADVDPWRDFTAPFDYLLADHAGLDLPMRRLDAAAAAEMSAESQRYRKKLATILLPRVLAYRRKVTARAASGIALDPVAV